MISIDIASLENDVLKSYHEMMWECCSKVEVISPLAVQLWSAVLKELDRRKLVRLISGSFDAVGSARIQKLW